MKTSELAKLLSDAIFKAGSYKEDKCQRIIFMGGKYPDNETNLGGYSKGPFQDRLERILRDILGDTID